MSIYACNYLIQEALGTNVLSHKHLYPCVKENFFLFIFSFFRFLNLKREVVRSGLFHSQLLVLYPISYRRGKTVSIGWLNHSRKIVSTSLKRLDNHLSLVDNHLSLFPVPHKTHNLEKVTLLFLHISHRYLVF